MVQDLLAAIIVVALFSGSEALTHIVTGANGYLGRAIVHELLWREGDIVCLVRKNRMLAEQVYWETDNTDGRIRVMEYDMLDGGATLNSALLTCEPPICVYHTASVFGPTEDHKETALGNVKGTIDLVKTLANYDNCKLILTSSMAAVRGSLQKPKNGKFYTEKDWNTISELGANWGASYQWSKAESERRATELCHKLGIPLVVLCPSFVFGPPYGESGSYSLELVGRWTRGQEEVQSRLFVDIRDVAKAHVQAGILDSVVNERFIVSTEARIPSSEIADYLKEVCESTKLSDPEKIRFDAEFDGGAIPIGEKEVEAAERLEKELGVKLRPVKDTIADMAKVLLTEQIG